MVGVGGDGDAVMGDGEPTDTIARPSARLASLVCLSDSPRPTKRARAEPPPRKVYFTRSRARLATQENTKAQTSTTVITPVAPSKNTTTLMESPVISTTCTTAPPSTPSSPTAKMRQTDILVDLRRVRGRIQNMSPTQVVMMELDSMAASWAKPPVRETPRFKWSALPPELRYHIIGMFVEARRHPSLPPSAWKLARYATVSRDFQIVIEALNFSAVSVNTIKIGAFDAIMRDPRRRRHLKYLELNVQLPAYDCEPCRARETAQDKMMHNQIFTRCFTTLFGALSQWRDTDTCPGGIRFSFLVSSPSDLRNATFELWQKRRWDSDDIGEKRFADSCIDFWGQDDSRRPPLLPRVHAITLFESNPHNRRAISPCAYAEIAARLPRLSTVRLAVHKDKRLVQRKHWFDTLAKILPHLSPTVDVMELSSPTTATWRDIPHATLTEKDSGRALGKALMEYGATLVHMRLRNVVKIRDLLRCVWPHSNQAADHMLFLLFTPGPPGPNVPYFSRLETIQIEFGTLYFNTTWRNPNMESLSNEETFLSWRQSLSMAAGTLAQNMPKLRHLKISQRPFMWAGKFVIRFNVGPREKFKGMDLTLVRRAPSWTCPDGLWSARPAQIAVLEWLTTSPYCPTSEIIANWDRIAEKRLLEFHYATTLEDGWRVDGHMPEQTNLFF